MISEKVERRWSVSISGNERGSPVDLIVVNSIDGDPKLAKVSVSGNSGRHEVTVPVAIAAERGHSRSGAVEQLVRNARLARD